MNCNVCYSEKTKKLKNSNECFSCGTTQYFKNQVGRPKLPQTKKHIGLRLSKDVVDILRSKPNQVAYIEALVRKDNNNVTSDNGE